MANKAFHADPKSYAPFVALRYNATKVTKLSGLVNWALALKGSVQKMPIACTYLHTNLTVKDIENMKDFYVSVFGCIPVREIQQLTGEWIERITAVKEGEIKYVHLRFPGHGDKGPELELVQYLNSTKKYDITPDTYGFGHLSFSVNDVNEALDAVIEGGGGSVGEVVTVEVPNRGLLTEVYATDPEGNIIELQSYA